MKLEGKIVGPWVDELHRTWCTVMPGLDSRGVSVDLRGVAFVDGQGKQLLREIYQKTGADFLTDSPLTKYFADQARQESPNNGEKGV